jgi:hypothetical protein
MRHFIACVLLVTLAGCSTSSSPTSGPTGSGTLTGKLTSSLGPVLVAVTVTATPSGSNALPSQFSQEDGTYTITNVPVGGGSIALSTLPAMYNCTQPAPTPYSGMTANGTVTVNILVQCATAFGTVSGTVTNSQGGTIAGATLTVTPTGGKAIGSVTSGPSGTYTVDSVWTPPATGTVAVSGLPSGCTTPAPQPYSGLTVGGTVTVNVAVTCSSSFTTTGLWVDGQYLLTSAQLATSGTPTPTDSCPSINRTLQTGVGAMAFDNSGNMWTQQPNNESDQIIEWQKSQLMDECASGVPTIGITFGPGGTTVNGMAFDKNGTLWVSEEMNETILGFTAAQLQSSGTPTPTYTLNPSGAPGTGVLYQPEGLTFDASGNLWVANYFSVIEFSPAQLAAATTSGGNTTPTPIAYLSDAADTASVDNSTLPPENYNYLAFDASGNLWVSLTATTNATLYADSVLEFTTSQLGQLTSNATPAASYRITETSQQSSAALQFGAIAFDANGTLWLGTNTLNAQGALISYPSTPAGKGGASVTINGPTGTFGFSLAFNPTPASLPIYGQRAPRAPAPAHKKGR